MYGFKNFGLIPKYIWPLLFFIGFVFLLIALKEFNKPTPDWLNLRKDLEGPFSFLNPFTQSIHGKLKNFENAKPLITSIYCWTMIFGFIGFFKFYFQNHPVLLDTFRFLLLVILRSSTTSTSLPNYIFRLGYANLLQVPFCLHHYRTNTVGHLSFLY